MAGFGWIGHFAVCPPEAPCHSCVVSGSEYPTLFSKQFYLLYSPSQWLNDFPNFWAFRGYVSFHHWRAPLGYIYLSYVYACDSVIELFHASSDQSLNHNYHLWCIRWSVSTLSRRHFSKRHSSDRLPHAETRPQLLRSPSTHPQRPSRDQAEPSNPNNPSLPWSLSLSTSTHPSCFISCQSLSALYLVLGLSWQQNIVFII